VASFLLAVQAARNPEGTAEFSSLSESGFIPTSGAGGQESRRHSRVLISFREWLHSYIVMKQGNFFGT